MKLSGKRCTIWPAAVLVAGLTAGCSKPDNKAEMVGKWQARPQAGIMSGIKEADRSGSVAQGKALAQYYSRMSAEFRPDNTFTLNVGLPMEGIWQVSDTGEVTSVIKIAGKPYGSKDLPMTGTLERSVKMLTLSPPVGKVIWAAWFLRSYKHLGQARSSCPIFDRKS